MSIDIVLAEYKGRLAVGLGSSKSGWLAGAMLNSLNNIQFCGVLVSTTV
jgi:hypothetical protein